MRRKRYVTAYALFLVLALGVYLFFRSSGGMFFQGLLEELLIPVQNVFYVTFVGFSGVGGKEFQELKKQNSQLLAAAAHQKELVNENRALRDQFSATELPPKQLLPAAVISSQSVTAGITIPTEIIIDKGAKDGVMPGLVVVYKDVLVGQVIRVSDHRATVKLVNSTESSIPAKTSKTNALGIVKGQDDAMLLEAVLLSDTLESGDTLITKGDVDEQGKGYPPGLLIGKITAVHKKASSLFQAAEVVPLLDANRLIMVFVYLAH